MLLALAGMIGCRFEAAVDDSNKEIENEVIKFCNRHKKLLKEHRSFHVVKKNNNKLKICPSGTGKRYVLYDLSPYSREMFANVAGDTVISVSKNTGDTLMVTVFSKHADNNRLFFNKSISPSYVDFPQNTFEVNGRLFYWDDTTKNITDDNIKMMYKYNLVDTVTSLEALHYRQSMRCRYNDDDGVLMAQSPKYPSVTLRLDVGLVAMYEKPKGNLSGYINVNEENICNGSCELFMLKMRRGYAYVRYYEMSDSIEKSERYGWIESDLLTVNLRFAEHEAGMNIPLYEKPDKRSRIAVMSHDRFQECRIIRFRKDWLYVKLSPSGDEGWLSSENYDSWLL